MLVKVEDLEVGDEIIIANGAMKYLKVLRKPKLSTKPDWKGRVRYTSVKCSTNNSSITGSYMGWQGKLVTYTERIWEVTGDGHNRELYQDLNHRPIWLVKKAI